MLLQKGLCQTCALLSTNGLNLVNLTGLGWSLSLFGGDETKAFAERRLAATE